MWADTRVWKISDVGLPEDASHALHSMLKILHGKSAALWQLSRSADADVLFVGVDAGARALDVARSAGKITVAVTEGRPTTDGCSFVLQRPFRVIQLLDLLDSIAEHLRKHPLTRTLVGQPWVSSLSLREALTQPWNGWRVASTDDGGSLWLGEGRAMAEAQVMQRLRQAPIELGRFMPSERPPPETACSISLPDLGWYIGMHTSGQLAPWLDERQRYSLQRWPDLGRVGATAMILELCAEASARPSAHAELIQRTDCDAVQASRFLTAASLAGWLQSAPPRRAVRMTDAPRHGGWMRLVSQLRKRLA
ncbi:hypothetical protein [Dyella sp.]|uniref:hypothetical protein n=1 Tax=Dyella sp. TaxID=1869338 RepID=UPI002ED59A34